MYLKTLYQKIVTCCMAVTSPCYETYVSTIDGRNFCMLVRV